MSSSSSELLVSPHRHFLIGSAFYHSNPKSALPFTRRSSPKRCPSPIPRPRRNSGNPLSLARDRHQMPYFGSRVAQTRGNLHELPLIPHGGLRQREWIQLNGVYRAIRSLYLQKFTGDPGADLSILPAGTRRRQVTSARISSIGL